ncbi:MAG TPA: sigma-70 family RNA polymerase sigma factor [Gemmataceae bacterium]|nr:sigma-70 family RNA polymerase sigma factor [Gemmataceae bacterium]
MYETDSSLHTRPSLLTRIRDVRDAEAWKLFVETYAPLVYRYARRQGLQDADAADVAQEVMVEAARCLRTFVYQPERGRFRDWLGTVSRRRLARFHRQQKHQEAGIGGADTDAVLEQATAAQAEAAWTDEFNAQLLRIALERARPHFEVPTWRAFERVWIENRPAAEAAGELGLPIDAIYLAKSRVLKRLREEIVLLAEDLPQFVPLS